MVGFFPVAKVVNADNKKVMVAGHLCLDIAPRFPKTLTGDFYEIFVPGKLIYVEDAVLSTGGPVSNTGLTMAKLGLDVALNGKVGDDGFGNIIKQLVGVQKAGAIKTVTNQNSSYSVALTPPGVDRIFLHHPGTNDTFAADDVDYKTAKKCVLFHLGYPPLMAGLFTNDGEELLKIYRRVKELGVTTCLDMALPDPTSPAGKANWEKIIEKVLPYVDIFVPSIEEIAFMLNRDLFDKRQAEAAGKDAVLFYKGRDYTDISNKLLAMGGKIIVLKSGIRGCYLRTAAAGQIKTIGKACPADIDAWSGREMWASSFKAAQLASAVGSGDAAIAGFLTAFLKGSSPQDSLQIANAVGWQNVQAIDAISGIEDWDATVDFVRDKTKARNELHPADKGWRYSDGEQIFYGPLDRA